MYCRSCGSLIPDGASNCVNCGAPTMQPVTQPVQPVYQQQVAQVLPVADAPAIKKKKNIAAIIGILFSVLSLFLCIVPPFARAVLGNSGASKAIMQSIVWRILSYVSLGCCPVALTCSIIGLVKSKTHGLKPMAIVGTILPFPCALISALVLFLDMLAEAMGY